MLSEKLPDINSKLLPPASHHDPVAVTITIERQERESALQLPCCVGNVPTTSGGGHGSARPAGLGGACPPCSRGQQMCGGFDNWETPKQIAEGNYLQMCHREKSQTIANKLVKITSPQISLIF